MEEQWNVWFCNEVPFAEGPYKFNGLPGLIFEVEDTQGIFKYSLIKIENLNKNLVTLEFNDEELSYTTWDKYSKVLLDFMKILIVKNEIYLIKVGNSF